MNIASLQGTQGFVEGPSAAKMKFLGNMSLVLRESSNSVLGFSEMIYQETLDWVEVADCQILQMHR